MPSGSTEGEGTSPFDQAIIAGDQEMGGPTQTVAPNVADVSNDADDADYCQTVEPGPYSFYPQQAGYPPVGPDGYIAPGMVPPAPYAVGPHAGPYPAGPYDAGQYGAAPYSAAPGGSANAWGIPATNGQPVYYGGAAAIRKPARSVGREEADSGGGNRFVYWFAGIGGVFAIVMTISLFASMLMDSSDAGGEMAANDPSGQPGQAQNNGQPQNNGQGAQPATKDASKGASSGATTASGSTPEPSGSVWDSFFFSGSSRKAAPSPKTSRGLPEPVVGTREFIDSRTPEGPYKNRGDSDRVTFYGLRAIGMLIGMLMSAAACVARRR